MITFEDLLKLRDNEVQELLKDNKYFKLNTLVVYEDDNKEVICKFIGFSNSEKQYSYIRDSYKATRTIPTEKLKILTYNLYKELKAKYIITPKKAFNSTKSVATFFKNSLNRVYGESFVDVEEDGYGEIHVKVHFPEIKIKNSLDYEHTIRDLYIKIRFYFYESDKKVVLSNMSLFRKTFTPDEVTTGYVHSHYSGFCRADQIGSICFGQTPLKQYILNSERRFNPFDIVFLITQLHNYLKWESLEGVPHYRINQLKPYIIKGTDGIRVEDKDNIVNSCYNHILSTLQDFSYFFKPIDEKYQIKLTNESIELIQKELIVFLKKTMKSNYKSVVVRKIDDSYGNLVSATKTYLEANGLTPKGNFTFKGEKLIPTIIESNNLTSLKNVANLYPKVVHPDILDPVISRLEEDFLEFFVNFKLNN